MKQRTLTMRFEGSLHHGSGYGRAGLVDRTILRDSAGMPYLAGSSIKGRFRHAVLRLVLAQGGRACQYGDEKGICKDGAICAVCQLFGSPYRQGSLIFSDARLDARTTRLLEEIHKGHHDSLERGDSYIRSATAMNRVLGTVQGHLLFTTEALPPELVFEARVLGEAGEYEGLLRLATKVLTHFGADGARGLGRCAYKLGEPK